MNLIRLALLYFRVGALNELQYRVNFFIQLLQSLVALGVGLIGLALVFSHTTALNGWTRPELLAVMGVHILMGGLINAIIQPNMQRLLEEVREGTLDYALTKPADSQAIVSVREFRIWKIVDVATGLIVLFAALLQLQAQAQVWQALAFAVALLFGWAMVYAFWLMLTSTVFWFIRIDELVNLFEGVYAAGRWPVSIYPDWLRTGLTFLIPVAFAVTVPAEALTGRLTWQTLLGAAGLAVGLMLIARLVWRAGLRRYSGASA
jgi:ABC-2 type transport system permease protein